MAEEKIIAVVRVRGSLHVKKEIADTLSMLNLKRVNHCTILSNNKVNLGMITKAKDYITWGEIDDKLLKKLVMKWGRTSGDKRIDEKYLKENKLTSETLIKKLMAFDITLKDAGIKPFFRLHPPTKGYERGGIKKPFNTGGALGHRGAEISKLIEKMTGLAK